MSYVGQENTGAKPTDARHDHEEACEPGHVEESKPQAKKNYQLPNKNNYETCKRERKKKKLAYKHIFSN